GFVGAERRFAAAVEMRLRLPEDPPLGATCTCKEPPLRGGSCGRQPFASGEGRVADLLVAVLVHVFVGLRAVGRAVMVEAPVDMRRPVVRRIGVADVDAAAVARPPGRTPAGTPAADADGEVEVAAGAGGRAG